MEINLSENAGIVVKRNLFFVANSTITPLLSNILIQKFVQAHLFSLTLHDPDDVHR